MQILAIGLWGCFFGSCLLVLSGAAFAFTRSMYRVGINASLSAIGPAFVAIAFLVAIPIENRDVLLRFLAHLTAVVGALLVYQLLNVLGSLRTASRRKRAKVFFVVVGAIALGLSWLLSPADALRLCGLVALLMAIYAWAVSIRNALRGDNLAWVAVIAVALVVSSYFGLLFGVLKPDQWTWQIQVLSAAAATGYMLTLGFINWQRYAYLLELKKVMAYGPAYDPVTRMRSQTETDQMVRDIFGSLTHVKQPLGVIIVTIANLYALEQLHGTAAVNSALFLTAVRLKRALPAKVDVGRVGFDDFVLIMQNCFDTGRLVALAHDLNQRLHKSVTLTTNPDVEQLETANTEWMAQVGIGVLHIKDAGTSSRKAIAMGRNMSRTAISYVSRVAWFDHTSGEITELAALQPDA